MWDVRLHRNPVSSTCEADADVRAGQGDVVRVRDARARCVWQEICDWGGSR